MVIATSFALRPNFSKMMFIPITYIRSVVCCFIILFLLFHEISFFLVIKQIIPKIQKNQMQVPTNHHTGNTTQDTILILTNHCLEKTVRDMIQILTNHHPGKRV